MTDPADGGTAAPGTAEYERLRDVRLREQRDALLGERKWLPAAVFDAVGALVGAPPKKPAELLARIAEEPDGPWRALFTAWLRVQEPVLARPMTPNAENRGFTAEFPGMSPFDAWVARPRTLALGHQLMVRRLEAQVPPFAAELTGALRDISGVVGELRKRARKAELTAADSWKRAAVTHTVLTGDRPHEVADRALELLRQVNDKIKQDGINALRTGFTTLNLKGLFPDDKTAEANGHFDRAAEHLHGHEGALRAAAVGVLGSRPADADEAGESELAGEPDLPGLTRQVVAYSRDVEQCLREIDRALKVFKDWIVGKTQEYLEEHFDELFPTVVAIESALSMLVSTATLVLGFAGAISGHPEVILASVGLSLLHTATVWLVNKLIVGISARRKETVLAFAPHLGEQAERESAAGEVLEWTLELADKSAGGTDMAAAGHLGQLVGLASAGEAGARVLEATGATSVVGVGTWAYGFTMDYVDLIEAVDRIKQGGADAPEPAEAGLVDAINRSWNGARLDALTIRYRGDGRFELFESTGRQAADAVLANAKALYGKQISADGRTWLPDWEHRARARELPDGRYRIDLFAVGQSDHQGYPVSLVVSVDGRRRSGPEPVTDRAEPGPGFEQALAGARECCAGIAVNDNMSADADAYPFDWDDHRYVAGAAVLGYFAVDVAVGNGERLLVRLRPDGTPQLDNPVRPDWANGGYSFLRKAVLDSAPARPFRSRRDKGKELASAFDQLKRADDGARAVVERWRQDANAEQAKPTDEQVRQWGQDGAADTRIRYARRAEVNQRGKERTKAMLAESTPKRVLKKAKALVWLP